MEKTRKLSPFRLASLLRLEHNPTAALHLFQSPIPTTTKTNKPFPYSLQCYDLIICKLARARLFNDMEQIIEHMATQTRFTPKEALFCRIISLYGRARMPGPALTTFQRIPSFHCLPTIRSFNTLLHALLCYGDFNTIQALCRDLEFTPDAVTYNVLIHAYAVSGSMKGAWDLFDEMRMRNIHPSVATFGTLISAVCNSSKLDEAFRLKDDMLRLYNMKPNAHIYTSLIKALCKNNKLDSALELKEEMRLDQEMVLDSSIYSTLIRAQFREGRKGEVVALLEEMKNSGVEADTVTYNAMIAGFCSERNFDAAFEALDEMERKGCKADVVSYNTILSGFCKEGRWRDARELFEDMPRRGCSPDVVSYRFLFDGLCSAGELKEAVGILDEMLFHGFKPGAASVVKLVEGLFGEGDGDLVNSGLSRLIEGNAMVLEGWEIVVSRVLKEPRLTEVQELMDSLKMG